jgi:hypothetical protein
MLLRSKKPSLALGFFERELFHGRAPHPSFLEWWDSTVVSRLGFFAGPDEVTPAPHASKIAATD